ncbi:UNVERIFIED_CONTAM: hypothetical protein GTU68_051154 [Idotea baltica]|nr:hypothetical protein [Idotea baltica]
MSHNGVQILEGLDNNMKLQTLDLACNRVDKNSTHQPSQ